MKAGRILLFACLFLWTGVSAWAIANPENRCSRDAAGAISNARYYDPELGRFIQPDTVIQDLSNPQSYNRYSYCVNDPLRYTDPTGLDYWGDVGGMFVGYYQAGASVVSGTAFMVAHPITTVEGVGTAVAHPVNTVGAIGSGIAKDWNSGAQGQGRVVGGALLAIGMAVAPGAEAGNLSKVGEVANAGEKVEGATAAVSKAEPITNPSRLLPENAGPTANISPNEVIGKTPAEIDARARQLGLEPRGPDPMNGRGSYIDPQTGQQRILSHPEASPPHGHVNNAAGERIGPNGSVVPPESPAAHLPIKDQ